MSTGYIRELGLTCKCGGRIRFKDWRTRGEFRYEAFCMDCKARDPNGYRTIKLAQVGAKEFFKA